MLRQVSLFAVLLLAPLAGGMADHAPLLTEEALRGVDVSHHQKQIEWDSVATKERVDFAFVKATEGQDFLDSMFCRNWSDLKRLGIRRGAYHFFRAYGCGAEQAQLFLSQVDMAPGDLAPVLDIECLDGMPPEVMIDEAHVWLDSVQHFLGIRPIIYSNQNFYERFLAGHFDDYPLWIARYSDERPFLNSGKNWDFWQFSNEGCLEGICKKVDLNIFPGNHEMLERLCWYPAPTPVKEARVVSP